jgi:hypothetical protein
VSKIRVGRSIAVVAIALAAIGGTACSSDGEAQTTTTLSVEERYCAAWSDVIDAFVAFEDIDVVADGTSAIDEAFGDLEAAVDELEVAADEQLTPSIEAFLASIEELSTALTSPELPVDRTDEVRAARDAVDQSWTEMVATLKTACPEVETPTS